MAIRGWSWVICLVIAAGLAAQDSQSPGFDRKLEESRSWAARRFGERLPESSAAVELWWASSGWKVPLAGEPPVTMGEAVLMRAARNESEAAQVVVRPRRALRSFRLRVEPLFGPSGAALPATSIDLLRVRYVPVKHASDPAGSRGPWPDPLPPVRGVLDLDGGRNHPFWVRVKIPRDAPAGTYAGALRLEAEGYAATVPLRVEVYDFTLPDRMTCSTAFGFDPGLVWRYQRIDNAADRRAVLEKYLENFSAHHISPYDPAPLDPFQVRWPALGDWTGGQRDEAERHSGRASLRVTDDQPDRQISAQSQRAVVLSDAGVRLALWHKTLERGQQFLVTLGHYDADMRWMPGRNNDIPIAGTGAWECFDRVVTSFPEGARFVGVSLWATPWEESGRPMGTVWYDDVSLRDRGTGEELLRGGEFEPVRPEDLVPEFDWSAWDRAMERALEHRHFSSFVIPIQGMGGGSFQERAEPELLGYRADTPEYRAAFRAYCAGVEEHLRARGWLDEAFVYWFDEPGPKDYAFVRQGFLRLREAAPDLRRMLTEQVEQELIGGPNIWCPVVLAYRNRAAAERRRAGETFWWYLCTQPKAPYCTLFLDHPGPELRVWLWLTWQHKVEGILVWQTNYWTSPAAYPKPDQPQNPYEDAMSWDVTPAGPLGPWPWGNGDGRFLYPPEEAGDGRPSRPVLEGPVDSIRWEALRDGIEDFEYLAILRNLVEQRGPSLSEGDGRRFAALLEVPAEIARGRTSFTPDPTPIERQRERIARAIEELTKH